MPPQAKQTPLAMQVKKPRLLLPKIDPYPEPPTEPQHSKTGFYDLPAELRNQIYKLALSAVRVHILPLNNANREAPHSLLLTTRQVRNEVLPLIHSSCAIIAGVTDFNFDGLLAWMARMPPDQEANLCKNTRLRIEICTTSSGSKERVSHSMAHTPSLRKWLHYRADPYRPQPKWKYAGAPPDKLTAYDMKRRARRLTREAEKKEMYAMLEAVGVSLGKGDAERV